jgi:DEAD/DEAH box helicase domain-containing protein
MSGIQLASCKEGNEIASKLGAKIILRGVLGRPVSLDDLPDMEPLENETIVPAPPVRVIGDVEVEPDRTVSTN